MTQVFKNNATGSLSAELSAVGTLASLATGQGARFPAPTGGDHFLATLILLDGNGAESAWEIVKCTARATDGLTIERAQEGTTARIWPAGTRIELRTTAGTLDSFTDTAQAAAAAPVQSVFGRTGTVTLQSADVTGALGFTPLDAAQKSAANGIAPLGADSKVPAAYLPSYVDDVLEYANTAGFPAIGETAKIYVALDTNKTYRWSGSAYIYITSGAVDSVAGKTGVVVLAKADVGLGNVDNTSDAAKPVSAAAQTALNLKADAASPTTTGTLTHSGDIVLSGSGKRITGDFSNATVANRVMFQTSTVNGNTHVPTIPNGSGVASSHMLFSSSDTANSSFAQFRVGADTPEVQLVSNKYGTGTYLPMTFYTGGAERMRLDTSGRALVGTQSTIGTSSSKIQLLDSATAALSMGVSTTPASGASIAGIDIWGNDGAAYFTGGTINFRATENWSSTNHGTAIQFRVTPNGAGGTLYEAMRVNHNGNLLINTSSELDNSKLIVSQSGDKTGIAVSTNSAGGSAAIRVHAATNNSTAMYMLTNGGINVAGGIYCSGSTTNYSTSSDYRLKTNIQPLQNALTRIAALKPCTYTWKADGSAGEGFIAHELQAVVPQCVTGKKDEVDACGNPVYQGVDTSFLVATLVAAIQELKSDFDAYKATHP